MARQFPGQLTRHSYWLAVLVPLLMPLAWAMRQLPGWSWLYAWVPLLVLYVLLPLLDLLLGRDLRNPEPGRRAIYPDTVIPVAAALSYLCILCWSLMAMGNHPQYFSWPALIGWTLSLGDIGGVIGINVAHELIHRRNPRLRGLGGLLLACVWYPCFKTEHPRWHHVNVATDADPSSAALFSSIYRQVPRALVLNTTRGWKLAAESARGKRRKMPALQHEMTAWYGLSLLLTLTAGISLGLLAGVVFVLQGVAAAALLEIVNYVEHYGLARKRQPDGRLEPPGVQHSWDCDYWLSNAILIQLPRHADHHTHPGRPFSTLQRNEQAPQLPLGYPLLVIIALVPRWWRSVIHPHLPDSQEKSAIIGS